MPITPPAFNVPILSPAALLDSSGDDNSAFDTAIELGQKYYYDSLLRQQADEAATARQTELEGIRSKNRIAEYFAAGVASGELVPTEQAQSLPGEVPLENVPVVRDTEGNEYYARSAIGTARTIGRRDEPIGTDASGRQYLPGTRRGDVMTDSGQVISEEVRKEYLAGNIDTLEAQFRSLVPAGAAPELHQMTEDFLAEARRQAEAGDFSLAEQREYEASVARALPVTDALTNSVRMYNRFERDHRGRIGELMGDAQANFEVLDNGQRRYLNETEMLVLAMRDAGDEALMDESQRQILNDLENSNTGRQLVPRIDVRDVREEMIANFTAAGSPDSDAQNAFAAFLYGALTDENKEIINDELARVIREVEGDDSRANVESFARRQYHNSAYRRAWAIFSTGHADPTVLNNYTYRGGVLPSGFSSNDTMEAMRVLFPAFNDVPALGSTLQFDEPIDSPETGVESESRYNTQRTQLEDYFSSIDPLVLDNMNAAISAAGGDKAEAARQLSALANGTQRQDVEDFLTYYSNLFSRYGQAQYREFADSIFVPTYNAIRNPNANQR